MNNEIYQKVYVNTLIDIASLTIRTSWPIEMSNNQDGQLVVNTNMFLRHLLKRSRATRSTFQLAVFYLFRIRPFIHQYSQFQPIVKCGRRMFLACLICAHKYLYDNTFTNSSWAKISRLPVKEINMAENALLQMLDYRLYVSMDIYDKFDSQLKQVMPTNQFMHTPQSTKRPLEQDIDIQHVKKQRQQSTYQIHYGIPTPEDNKIEL